MAKRPGPKDDDRERQARSLLDRVAGAGDGLGGGARAASDQARRKMADGGYGIDEATDPAAIWGKRVGRGLGIAFLVWLVYHLLTTYVLAG